MSIRTRLLLLLFAVWLPAMVGFALVARSTYLREEETARQSLQEIADLLNQAVERELDKRVVMARALASTHAVRDADFRRFHEEATAALQGTDSWAIVIDRDWQFANTRTPYRAEAPIRRLQPAPFVDGEPQVLYRPTSPLVQTPVLGAFVAAPGAAPPRHNVVVGFPTALIQQLAMRNPVPPGSVASVINQDQMVMARTRNPDKWLGMHATGDLVRRASAGESGFTRSVTLDGVPSISYLSPPNRHGWTVVIALPEALLQAAARRLTEQALAASVLLLAAGAVVAWYAARRLSATVLALSDAARQLGQDQVPPRLVTGVTEADAVSAALHDAAVRSHEASRTLQRRVAEAVEQARDAQARLLEAQKHEAIGRLTGGIAHDFNNLLQTITTAHHLLSRTTHEGPQLRVLQSAMRASAKAAELIRQMLTFGRAQPLQPQPVALDDFVLKSQELTAKAVGERITLRADIAPQLPAVFVDPNQLELALLNLVFNARDAMPRGGHITVRGRHARPAETTALPAGRFVCLEVADDGQGMDVATQAKAFEPYFTTKPVGAGSGIGLSQVLAFARQSGGDAWLHSEPGTGTCVTLCLPAAGHAQAAIETPVADRGVWRPLRVLMVEDDPLVASVVSPALQAAGHALTLLPSADEALAALQAGAAVDVLFTDVVMPGRLSGLDLADWCAEHRPELPVVVATGYSAQPADAATERLRKPYGIDELEQALQRAVEHKRGPVAGH